MTPFQLRHSGQASLSGWLKDERKQHECMVHVFSHKEPALVNFGPRMKRKKLNRQPIKEVKKNHHLSSPGALCAMVE